ncbi:tripartite tricarboxylate transporter substrate binding protein [Achromobacter sp. SLBN-14]|uniref:Bug family tripartite tricarboxylate transporter substrate binding protein n=1 Tax=Achromobacter sp. SLBN-14 TaxID=2768442 RepID=UPI0011745910|nr:tripartite tricarboxylate transporter substrate binding protein [Achromobacter sp. SLBN-14]TQJ96964.1 tripartite-type tricarboxylate transporter receptor subunit TctC [Achromobacter sp. SLBN-14]
MSNQRAGGRWSRRQVLGAVGAAVLGMPGLARAQSDRPVKFILPVGVGSGVDTITRAAGPALSAALGHTVVVENQPGAGGIVGTSALVRSAPDGYTLSMLSNNHVIFPSVYKNLPFDPLADITPISMIGMTPFLLVANPQKISANDIQALTALLTREPGRFNYASSGNGTILHLAAEMYVQQAGVKARHIPYKGVGPMMADLIGGQVDFGVLSLPSVLPQIKSGALKALGACGGERMAALPDLPTLREQGMADYEIGGWFAAAGPAKLPQADVRRIFDALARAFNSPEVKQSMATQNNRIVLMPPEQTVAYFRSEMAKYAAVVKGAGLELM